MSHAISYSRRDGEPFDDARVEDFVRARARGASIKVASEHAGIGYPLGMKLEKEASVLTRRKELNRKNTVVTVSKSWVMEQLRQNAEEAREEKQYKSSNEALKLLYEIMTRDAALLEGVAESLPRSPEALRAEIRKRLSSPVIVTAGVETSSEPDDGEAAQ